MTGDQVWGIVGVGVGIAMLLFRRFISVGGRDVDRFDPDNNLANPDRKPSAPQDQRLVIIVALVFIGAGILYMLQVLPGQ